MALERTSIGSSTTKISRRTSQSPTNRSARMAPSAGQTLPSTRSTTFISARRTRPLQRLARWSTMARRCIITHHVRLSGLRTQGAMLSKGALPQDPAQHLRRGTRVARALAKTKAFEISRRERKRIEMLFAHLKRILRLGRLRLRGPYGAQVEFTLAAIAQNLRRLAKLVARPPPIIAVCTA